MHRRNTYTSEGDAAVRHQLMRGMQERLRAGRFFTRRFPAITNDILNVFLWTKTRETRSS
jgi:hypothetical protein